MRISGVRAPAAFVLLLSWAAGCATSAPPPAPEPIPVVEKATEPVETAPEAELPYDPLLSGLHVECDRARLVVPRRFEGDLRMPPPRSTAPYHVTLKGLGISSRDVLPEVVIAGDDLSLVAEGSVRLTRDIGGGSFYREGPFQTFIVRNGAMLRR